MQAFPPGLLEAAFALSTHAVIAADAAGRVTHANPAASSLFRYGIEELCTLVHVSDLYHRVEDARAVMRSARAGSVEPNAVTLRSRSGELIPVRMHVRLLLDAQGGMVGSFAVVEDRREAQELSTRLEDVTGQVVASEKRAAVIALSAQAAHELSQPLMAAMGNIELALMATDIEPRLSARLQKTYTQLERMRAIVGDFVRMTTTRTLPPDRM